MYDVGVFGILNPAAVQVHPVLLQVKIPCTLIFPPNGSARTHEVAALSLRQSPSTVIFNYPVEWCIIAAMLDEDLFRSPYLLSTLATLLPVATMQPWVNDHGDFNDGIPVILQRTLSFLCQQYDKRIHNDVCMHVRTAKALPPPSFLTVTQPNEILLGQPTFSHNVHSGQPPKEAKIDLYLLLMSNLEAGTRIHAILTSSSTPAMLNT